MFEQLVYFGMLHRMTKADASAAARRWLERLGITEYADYCAEKLSKGNQQKVQLIVTLLHDPELIILDEPFSGLDPRQHRAVPLGHPRAGRGRGGIS